jgi:hypothetical protein
MVSNDTRATPIINMMAQTPAKIGASTHSWLEGVTVCGQVQYLTVIVSIAYDIVSKWSNIVSIIVCSVPAGGARPGVGQAPGLSRPLAVVVCGRPPAHKGPRKSRPPRIENPPRYAAPGAPGRGRQRQPRFQEAHVARPSERRFSRSGGSVTPLPRLGLGQTSCRLFSPLADEQRTRHGQQHVQRGQNEIQVISFSVCIVSFVLLILSFRLCSKKRQVADTYLGRVLNPAPEDSEDDEEEDDEAKQPAKGGRWPWQMLSADRELYRNLRDRCPTFAATESGFRMNKDIIKNVGHMKIHDWMVLSGSMMAYVIKQCEGITDEYKVLLSDWFYMLEVWPLF